MIDVRFAGKFEHHHALNCINIPLQGLREAILELDEPASYVVIKQGRGAASLSMNEGGLDTFVLDHRHTDLGQFTLKSQSKLSQIYPRSTPDPPDLQRVEQRQVGNLGKALLGRLENKRFET